MVIIRLLILIPKSNEKPPYIVTYCKQIWFLQPKTNKQKKRKKEANFKRLQWKASTKSNKIKESWNKQIKWDNFYPFQKTQRRKYFFIKREEWIKRRALWNFGIVTLSGFWEKTCVGIFLIYLLKTFR